MQFSTDIQEQLRDSVRLDPLREGEIRRIEGMGHTYLSSAETRLPTEYDELVKILIDGERYSVLRKIVDRQGGL